MGGKKVLGIWVACAVHSHALAAAYSLTAMSSQRFFSYFFALEDEAKSRYLEKLAIIIDLIQLKCACAGMCCIVICTTDNSELDACRGHVFLDSRTSAIVALLMSILVANNQPFGAEQGNRFLQ